MSNDLFTSASRLGNLTRPAPLTPTAFINNITSRNVRDPGASARSAVSNVNLETQRTAQRDAFTAKLNDLNQWSKGVTGIVQQGANARRARAEAQRMSARQIGQEAGAQARQMWDAQNVPGGGGSNSYRDRIVRTAMSYIGTPYAWGGGSATVRVSRGIGLGTQNVIGVDCSGLTSFAYNSIGMRIPRHSNTQTSFGVKTSLRNARPGDIIGWARGGHVAIYIGNGMIVEAARPGTTVRTRKLGAGESAYAVRLKLPGE